MRLPGLLAPLVQLHDATTRMLSKACINLIQGTSRGSSSVEGMIKIITLVLLLWGLYAVSHRIQLVLQREVARELTSEC